MVFFSANCFIDCQTYQFQVDTRLYAFAVIDSLAKDMFLKISENNQILIQMHALFLLA